MKPLEAILAFVIGVLAMSIAPVTADQLTPADVRAIAKEAYIYGFPLVDTYRIQHSYFVDRDNTEFKAPWNPLYNNARVYTPDDTALQTPNSDTPYSYVGADLRAEPLVLTVPEVEAGRYYSLQFIDVYTFNFAYVGSRATGNGGGQLTCWPGRDGRAPSPDGITAVIRCETDFAFILYRTQLFDPADIENVKTVQAGYEVRAALRLPAASGAPPAAASVDFVEPLVAGRGAQLAAVLQHPELRAAVLPRRTLRNGADGAVRTIGIASRRGLDQRPVARELQAAVTAGWPTPGRTSSTTRRPKLDTGKMTSGRGLRDPRLSQEQLPLPHRRGGARHLRQLHGRGDLSRLLRRLAAPSR